MYATVVTDFFKQAYMLNYFALMLVPAWLIFRQRNRPTQGAEGKAPTETLPALPREEAV